MSIAFNFGAALPEIVLTGAACVILVVDLFVPDSRRQISYWLTQLALLAAAYLTLVSPDDAPLRAFGNMFVTDKLADVLKLFVPLAKNTSGGTITGPSYEYIVNDNATTTSFQTY